MFTLHVHRAVSCNFWSFSLPFVFHCLSFFCLGLFSADSAKKRQIVLVKSSRVLKTSNTLLANFWKVEVGTLEKWCDLDYDREAIIARAKPSLFFSAFSIFFPKLCLILKNRFQAWLSSNFQERLLIWIIKSDNEMFLVKKGRSH